MNQKWFEMNEVRKRRLEDSVWVPLRAIEKKTNNITYGREGFLEEFYGIGTLAVFQSKRDASKDLKWSEIGISHTQHGGVQNDKYIQSDIYADWEGNPLGIHLVIDQRGNRLEPNEWHLHQDFVVTLDLRREGDQWVCIHEGYEIVARLSRDSEGKPTRMEVKSSFLKDYLCASKTALLASSYRSRLEVFGLPQAITWKENPFMNLQKTSAGWDGYQK